MGETRTVLVCGSRDWPNPNVIQHFLRQLPSVLGTREITVIHGAARGADEMAGRIADSMGFGVREFPADWRGKGKRAGIIRNLAMLDEEPDLVLAFQANGSTGTQHTIDEARRRRIPVEVYELPPPSSSGGQG